MKPVIFSIAFLFIFSLFLQPERALSASSESYILSWAMGKSMVYPRYNMAVAVAGNGKIYVIGGDEYTNLPLNYVEEYDPASNSWRTRTPMPTRRWAVEAVTGANGNIYVIGGENCGAGSCSGSSTTQTLNVVEEYNPVSDTWRTLANMPTPRANLGLVAASNGKIYAIGGSQKGTGDLSVVEEYNPATNSWQTKASLPSPRQEINAVEMSGKIYAIGMGTRVDKYDIATNTWYRMADMPTPRWLSKAVAVKNGRIYEFAGENNGILTTVLEYNPQWDLWRILPNRLMVPRASLGAAILNDGKIYAIGGNGPGGIGYGGIGPLKSMEIGTLTTTTNAKPVAVLVHGWNGLRILNLPLAPADHCTPDTQADHITSASDFPNPNNLQVFALNLLRDNWDVYWVHLETSPNFTAPIEYNAECLRNQLSKIPSPSGKFVLIAHSMGGLVSRAYMENPQPRYYQNNVDRLITIGSPHVGTPYGYNFCVQGDLAACQFSTIGIEFYNAVYWHRARGVSYNLFGGDLTPGPLGEAIFLTEGYNDGVVGVDSAMGRKYHMLSAPTVVIDANNGNDMKRYYLGASHVDLAWGYPSYFSVSDSDKATLTATYACVRYLLGIPGGICPSTATAPVAPEKTDTFIGMGKTPTFSGHLAQGQSASHNLPADTSLHSGFELTWTAGKMSLTLTDSLGKVIDPAYAAVHPSEVSYYENQTDTNSQLFAFYDLNATQQGSYTLNVQTVEADASGLDYSVQGYIQSPRQLSFQADKTFYRPNDSGVLTAFVKNVDSGVGISGATVQVEISNSGIPIATIPLTDQGNGEYSTTYIMPNLPGYLGVKVTASGTDAGIAYARQVNEAVAISAPAVQLTGANSDSPQDADSDGKYEALNLEIQANVSQAGDYTISGDLFNSSNTIVAHGMANLTLPQGPSSLILPFNGDEIRFSGLNGPFTLTNFSIFDQGHQGVPIILEQKNLWVTSSYNWEDFAVHCYTLLAQVSGRGTLDINPKPNCQNGTQYTVESKVTLNAVPAQGSTMLGWIGDVDSTDTSIEVVMNKDMSVTANIFPSRWNYLPVIRR
jgi:N-acetylneuraminic acid mutarotase/pimeloyl-ACP methyl ester carboxylesterase